MKSEKFLKVNAPNIVHETIDGETVLLDLNTGNYYSLEGPGALIWQYIDLTGNREKPIGLLSDGSGHNNDVEVAVNEFVDELIKEKLLIETGIAPATNDTAEIEKQLHEAATEFTAPKVNKYSDMQDLLLLDPIHEVDEQGWPEGKAPADED